MSKYRFVFGIAAAIVVADQAVKWYVDRTLRLYESVPVIEPLFHITYVRNTGGAFGLLAAQPAAVRLPFFLAVSLAAVAVLLHFLRSVGERQRLLLFAFAAILGGAIGNFIDRALMGEVIDFLDFHWRGYYWPAFNVADSCITVGALLLLGHSFLKGSAAQQQDARRDPSRASLPRRAPRRPA